MFMDTARWYILCTGILFALLFICSILQILQPVVFRAHKYCYKLILIIFVVNSLGSCFRCAHFILWFLDDVPENVRWLQVYFFNMAGFFFIFCGKVLCILSFWELHTQMGFNDRWTPDAVSRINFLRKATGCYVVLALIALVVATTIVGSHSDDVGYNWWWRLNGWFGVSALIAVVVSFPVTNLSIWKHLKASTATAAIVNPSHRKMLLVMTVVCGLCITSFIVESGMLVMSVMWAAFEDWSFASRLANARASFLNMLIVEWLPAMVLACAAKAFRVPDQPNTQPLLASHQHEDFDPSEISDALSHKNVSINASEEDAAAIAGGEYYYNRSWLYSDATVYSLRSSATSDDSVSLKNLQNTN